MSTNSGSATAVQARIADLMDRATRSTANLGWLQDYTSDWQTCRSLAIRIAAKQNQLPTKDEEAYNILLAFITFATNKCESLEVALQTRREQHERLMLKVLTEQREQP